MFFTIRPGRLSRDSVAYEFTSIPGRVLFPFSFSLVAVTRIRASVSTPPDLLDEESILANKHTLHNTHLGAPLPAYPYKTRVGCRQTMLLAIPTTWIGVGVPSHKKDVSVRFGGSTRNAMLTHKTTPLPESFAGTTLRRRTTARRGFTAQGPCRGKALSQRIEDAQLRTT